ncbi:hypothetical protein DL93DRAFT_2159594 [Clavulina sp. PMI_390]|nr:hypothetical protein DL93DRAFT_2159594 [Clavulina sp. PMI_390]
MSFSVGSVYQLVNKATGTVADLSQRDQRSLIGYKSHGKANQQTLTGIRLLGDAFQFVIEAAPQGLYYIRCTKGDMPYITYEGTPRSTDKLLCTRNKRPWKIIRDPVHADSHPPFHRIVHPEGHLCMDLTRSDPADGTAIILYELTRNPNQAWTLKLMKDFNPTIAPRFRLANKATETVADIARHNESVVGDHHHDDRTQIWTTEVVDESKNLYLIKNVGTGKYLSFHGAPTANNPLLATSFRQEWEVRLQGSSIPQLVRIYAPRTNFVVDLTRSLAKPGTPVILYPAQSPGLNQQWKVEPEN